MPLISYLHAIGNWVSDYGINKGKPHVLDHLPMDFELETTESWAW